MAGKFEIYKDKAGAFRFRLKASNGQIILTSEGYKAKTSCKNGIESVRKNSQNDARFERRETKAGKARFNLKASNGQIIGTSEAYETAVARDNGIKSVAGNAPIATVSHFATDPVSKRMHLRAAPKSMQALRESAERDSDALERLAKR